METRRDAADTTQSDHGSPDATASWTIVVGAAVTVIHLASVFLLAALRSLVSFGGYVVYVVAAQAVLWSVALAAFKPFTRTAWLRRAVYSSLAAGALMTWVTMLAPMAMADLRDGTRWVEGTAMWTGWPTQAIALVPLSSPQFGW